MGCWRKVSSDLWPSILDFLYDARVWYCNCEACQNSEKPPVGIRLICKFLTATVNCWIQRAVSAGMQPGRVLRLPAALSRQTRAVLALSRASEPLISSITRIEGKFLSVDLSNNAGKASLVKATLHEELWSQALGLVTSARNLLSIGGPFFQCCQWVQVVDLRQLAALTKIGSDFFSHSSVQKVLLPVSLESVGDKFLAGCKMEFMDFSSTSLTSVGDEFLSESSIRKVTFPRTLRTVGDGFLERFSGRRLDLSNTRLESVGDRFLSGSGAVHLLLPRSFCAAGHHFLYRSSAVELDLSQTTLVSVGDSFLSYSFIVRLKLPNSLLKMGHNCLEEFAGRRLDLSMTALETVGGYFLACSKVMKILFPNSMKNVGDGFLYRFLGKQLDLSRTELRSAGDEFLLGTDIESLLLPAAFVRQITP